MWQNLLCHCVVFTKASEEFAPYYLAEIRHDMRQTTILRVLVAEHRRTQRRASSSHYELVKALGGDKGNISHSLHTLEERGWIVILRTPGGQANAIDLTPEGLKNASEIWIKL